MPSESFLLAPIEIKPGHKYALVYVGDCELSRDQAEEIQALWRDFMEDPDPARIIVFNGREIRLMGLPPRAQSLDGVLVPAQTEVS